VEGLSAKNILATLFNGKNWYFVLCLFALIGLDIPVIKQYGSVTATGLPRMECKLQN
jgi:hypothetical protein